MEKSLVFFFVPISIRKLVNFIMSFKFKEKYRSVEFGVYAMEAYFDTNTFYGIYGAKNQDKEVIKEINEGIVGESVFMQYIYQNSEYSLPLNIVQLPGKYTFYFKVAQIDQAMYNPQLFS